MNFQYARFCLLLVGLSLFPIAGCEKSASEKLAEQQLQERKADKEKKEKADKLDKFLEDAKSKFPDKFR